MTVTNLPKIVQDCIIVESESDGKNERIVVSGESYRAAPTSRKILNRNAMTSSQHWIGSRYWRRDVDEV